MFRSQSFVDFLDVEQKRRKALTTLNTLSENSGFKPFHDLPTIFDVISTSIMTRYRKVILSNKKYSCFRFGLVNAINIYFRFNIFVVCEDNFLS